MAGITLEKDKTIDTYGQPITALHLIADGKVRTDYPGGSYLLGRGDVIGICEICSDIHFLSYTAVENTTILTYPLSGADMLSDLLQKHADVARFFLISACRQICTLQNRLALSEINCSSLYRSLRDDYEKYNSLCERYRIKALAVNGIDGQNAWLESESEEPWLNGYYQGLTRLYGGKNFREFIQEREFSLGVLRRGSQDFQRARMELEEQFQYRQQIASLYFNEGGSDLLNCFTSLYGKLDDNAEEKAELQSDIRRMHEQLKDGALVPSEQLKNRMQKFYDSEDHTVRAEETETSSALPTELSGSLNVILQFADLSSNAEDTFRKHVSDYRALSEKSSMDDPVIALRRALTNEFYTLYTAVFKRTLEETEIPLPVRMFLYFGYVDEELAGTKNAATLSRIAAGIKDNSEFGLYTFYHWLTAIYDGRKEPSRNEFDQDYTEYIHKQKAQGNITEKELAHMETDRMSRVEFELQNLFPSANKVTFGRPSTFCPLFTSESALKDLDSAYITVSAMAKAMEQVRKVDYSAFYRSGLDMDHIDVMSKTPVHTEYLPDFILLPNAGIRGVMWQEIEGKKRNTNSRMCFSIFHMEDLNTTFLRLTGEFRWEMCKRVQGGRWNDISERSLTSEYFDYVQFYRKNRDLSAEAKDRVRTALLQAKNSFKEMFVRDYVQWVLFEGNGSPRLNKVARSIFFTYCPFTTGICDMLDSNPLYSELLAKHRLQNAQKRHQLDMQIQRLRNSGTPVPESLEQEREYYNK
ncbi:MAG: hypothetical protein NC079_03830 [Clostridium sp.]|nr:hypothetical protein [Acetatifactor muris]MCM1526129.1 hypothetical protein [Bacteroides sp.]MCM1562723.1 hypothetical protein [Clostridium sp.]